MSKKSLGVILSIILFSSIILAGSQLSFASQQKTAVLFFDDGWENQISVLPILQLYCFGATFAIITGSIGGDYMTSQQIQSIASNPTLEIASHGVTHTDLNSMPLAQANSELIQSKAFLEALTGKTIFDFVYPYNDYSAQTDSLAYSANYTGLRSNLILWNNDYGYTNTYLYSVGSESLSLFQQNVVSSQSNNLVEICYHQIISGASGDEATDPNVFAQEMSWLSSNGYTVVSMSQYLGHTPMPTSSPTTTATPTPTLKPTPTITPSSTPKPTATPTPITNMTAQDYQDYNVWLGNMIANGSMIQLWRNQTGR